MTLECLASADGQYVTVRVSDTGPGFSADLREKFNSPFTGGAVRRAPVCTSACVCVCARARARNLVCTCRQLQGADGPGPLDHKGRGGALLLLLHHSLCVCTGSCTEQMGLGLMMVNTRENMDKKCPIAHTLWMCMGR